MRAAVLLLALLGCSSEPVRALDAALDAVEDVADGGCRAGAVVCEGDVRATCGAGGALVDRLDCAAQGGVCAPGIGCARCLPGARRCGASELVERCADDGRAWVGDGLCEGAGVCREGRCVDPCEGVDVGDNNAGCEFYATTGPNLVTRRFDYGVVVANPSATPRKVVVEGGGLEVRVTRVLAPGGAESITLPWITRTMEFTGITPVGAYRIRSDGPIAAYQFSPLRFQQPGVWDEGTSREGTFSNDASLLLPTRALGRHYMALTYTDGNPGVGEYVLIVGASETPARVTVRPTVALDRGTGATGGVEPMEFTLARGAAMLLRPHDRHDDLSGTRIDADRSVSVFAGNECTDLPAARPYCDHLEEQLPPVETWGSEYVLVPFQHAQGAPYVARVAAWRPNTTVHFEPASTHPDVTLNAGEIVDFTSTRAAVIRATEPVMVQQFMVGSGASSTDGDPAQTTAVPVQQYRREYTFLVPDTYTRSFVQIIGRGDAVPSLDGAAVSAQPEATGREGLRSWSIEIPPGAHRIEGAGESDRFGLVVYGVAEATSYAYPGGLQLDRITPP